MIEPHNVLNRANAQAQLCQRTGTTVPTQWHYSANAMALFCQRNGKALATQWQSIGYDRVKFYIDNFLE